MSGASNLDDVLDQLQAAGLIIPSNEGLRIGTHKPVRVFTQDGGREKRGWYWLKEWSPSIDRLLIVGSFGIWHGSDKGAQKVALPKDDTGRITPMAVPLMVIVGREALPPGAEADASLLIQAQELADEAMRV